MKAKTITRPRHERSLDSWLPIHCTYWVSLAVRILVVFTAGNVCFAQLRPADQARYQQQMAAMQQTARAMQERARQTALENERRMREMRERQEALMQRQR